MNNSPKISIITVVRNGEKFMEHTIQSILNQTYCNIEYIVIDGNSTDKTIDIIKRYADQISYWVSEKDNGIYDAMNKGVKAATGEWLLFINSDDFLASNSAIEESVTYLVNCTSLIAYGNAIIMYAAGPDAVQGGEWKSLKHQFRNISMNLSHQATFHSKLSLY